MKIEEAMKERHTVRKYVNRKIPGEIVNQITARIKENNEKYGLNMKLVTDNSQALNFFIKLTMAKNVCNLIILAGKNMADVAEKIGYCGADVMLFTQSLGLNSWWIGSTYSFRGVKQNLDDTKDCKIYGIIAIGYGATKGIPHKSKRIEEISSYHGDYPDWFKMGIETVLLAPTAMNKQAFKINGVGNKVSMACDNGIYSDVDLGIGKYYFEVGAGKENFQWL